MVDRIDPAHRFLARLFFDNVDDSPGVRAIMNIPLNVAGFIPKSARMAPIAPSTLIGSDFFALANAFSTARGLHAHAFYASVAHELEQTLSAGFLAWTQ